VDEIIAFKVYGENSGRFGFGNQSLLAICVQLIVNRTLSEPCEELNAKGKTFPILGENKKA
jgi:hypothetical protein